MKTLKHILTIALLMLPVLAASARSVSKAGIRQQLSSLVRDFKHEEDFNAINLGPFASSIVKGIIGSASDSDEDMKQFVKAVKGIRSFTVVDYEDCSSKVKAQVQSRVEYMLSGMTVLIETKDGGDVVKICGEVSEDGSTVSDIIIYTSDCALIYLRGTISMDRLAASMR